ncbi:LamG domain-containing protein [Gimesia maris]|uniref:LamG domain-containing protein n=1 Tax=Gimesia maris TaxID=122 RepID=UPI00241CC5E4|nr:LamG domain-containing protein [Gimesia maris]|tara:strand:- start:34645 stop:35376 length:732 start_codon:yes stop_codon:yes gene_type:complete
MKFNSILIAVFSLSLACPLTAAEPEKATKEKKPQGLHFDGKSSYVTFPHIKLEDYGEFTIEAWVKDWSGRICCQGKQGDPENSIWISLRAKHHSAGWESDNGMNHSVPIDPNSIEGWDHFAMVYSELQQTFYLNGKQIHQTSAPAPGPFDESRLFFIGAQEKWEDTQTKPAALFGKGCMRMFRISKVARYDKEFEPADRFTSDAETVVLFDFAKPDKDMLFDASPNKNNGIIYNARWVDLKQD